MTSFFAWLACLTTSSLVLIGCTGPAPAETTMPMPSPMALLQEPGTQAATPSLESAPLESPQTAAQTPIYWLGASTQDVHLYREFRQTPNVGDPITTALAAMTRAQPLDPDYVNPWSPASAVSASMSGKNLITVDISADAFDRRLDAGMAYRAVQQLVYTASAAAASSGLVPQNQQIQVAVLVDGRSGYEAFGHIPLDDPMVRDSTLLAPVWIVDPQEHSVYPSGTVQVSGRGVSADGKLGWQLLRVDPAATGERRTKVYSAGSVSLREDDDGWGTYGFSISVQPGDYELRVFEDDAGSESADTTTFTVG